jgi:hypothetical protein
MTWTYDPALGSDTDKVRFYVQDTDTNDQLLTNEEIAATLSASSGVYRAAEACARAIALKLGRLPSVKLAIAGLDSKEQYEFYMGIAAEMASKATTRGGGVFAGGISKSDKKSREADSDRPKPAFTTVLHDA